MEQHQIKKIVIIGPESTGKSTLCTQLAEHFTTSWCPEYAREYLLKNGMNYSYDNLLTIAKGQVQLEEEYVSKTTPGKPLFIDTDLYVMKVWCEFVFGKCHQWILDGIAERKYNLYLLCKPDLPWIKDELREYSDEETRIKLYHYYLDLLVQQPVPWIEISGSYEERLQKAIEAVEKIIS
jgi:NadR type nicotinamide-nucleotide adenylyltransferase